MHDELHGHVGGAHGMLMETQDGGKHWEHRLHNVDNDAFLTTFRCSPPSRSPGVSSSRAKPDSC
ncbi:MAG: hypothetical protein H6990_04170 [Pseudomonadales bacterium]|nr:hypothetical protein [Pseudomonadales bacterium]